MPRLFRRCCFRKVDLLVAGGVAAMLSLTCPLPPRTRPPLFVICYFVFAQLKATSTASGQLVVNLFLFRGKVERAILVQS